MEFTKEKPMQNYSGQGWEGKNYNLYTDIKDIAKKIKEELKKKYPQCVFSVSIERYSGGQSLNLSLMKAPFEVFNKEHTQDKNGNIYTEKDYQYSQLNHYTLYHKNADGYNNGSYLTKETEELLTYAVQYTNSFNFDDSDAQIDYSHTNFYLHLAIGKWDNPFIKTNSPVI